MWEMSPGVVPYLYSHGSSNGGHVTGGVGCDWSSGMWQFLKEREDLNIWTETKQNNKIDICCRNLGLWGRDKI